MRSLDAIGIQSGTDKSRLRWDYLRWYERMMSPFADMPMTIMEIGIHNGASLRTWEAYFPLASIVGVDIEPATMRFARERVTIEIGSQADRDFLTHLASKYRPHVIIDDGSHVDEHQILTFEILFEALAPGGVYVVEDVTYPIHEGSAADYFCALGRDLLLGQGRPDVASVASRPKAFAIWKPSRDELDGDLDALEAAAAHAELPESLFYLAEYMRRTGAPLERALDVAKRASAADPHNGWIMLEISRILAQKGDTPGAIAAAEEGARLVHRMSGVIPAPFAGQLEALRRL